MVGEALLMVCLLILRCVSHHPPRYIVCASVFNYFEHLFYHTLQQYYPSSSSRHRLVQPNSLWTAGCCVYRSNGSITYAESIAVIGNNDKNSSCTLTRAVHLWELEWLLVPYNATYPADIFPGYSGCRNKCISFSC